MKERRGEFIYATLLVILALFAVYAQFYHIEPSYAVQIVNYPKFQAFGTDGTPL